MERSGASLPGRRGLAPHRPHGFSSGCRRVSVKTRLPMFLACVPLSTGAMDGVVRVAKHEPPISSLTTNRAAQIEKPENQSLWGYRFRVVPWRDKVCPFPRGFFYQMTIVENTNRAAGIIEAEASREFQDRIFRSPTPEAIARQLRVMHTRWFNRTDRDYDLEDEYEEWMMEVLIAAIEEGGLTLK